MTQNGDPFSELRQVTVVYKSMLAALLWHRKFGVVRLTKENEERSSIRWWVND
jgi:hypothetical protein